MSLYASFLFNVSKALIYEILEYVMFLLLAYSTSLSFQD